MEWQEFFHRVADAVFPHEGERQAAHDLINSNTPDESPESEDIPEENIPKVREPAPAIVSPDGTQVWNGAGWEPNPDVPTPKPTE